MWKVKVTFFDNKVDFDVDFEIELWHNSFKFTHVTWRPSNVW